MLAELYYPEATSIAFILEDLGKVLSGTTDKSLLSLKLNQEQSSIIADKTQASWEVVTTVPYNTAASTDLMTGANVAIGGAKILRQPCSTFPTRYRYLKLAVVLRSSVIFALASNIGTGSSGNFLTGYHDVSKLNSGSDVGQFFARLGTTTANPMRFTVYSSPSATLIQLADVNLIQNTQVVLAIFDFENKWYRFDSSGMPFVYTVPCSSSAWLNTDLWYSTPMTVGGLAYGADDGNGGYYGSEAIFSICTTKIPLSWDLYHQAAYKFAGFKSTGQTYDLLNFGVNTAKFGHVNGSLFNTRLNEQFPYSSITDTTNVYLINQNSFGPNGGYYQTPVGTRCKFGWFMAEVG